MIVVVDQLEELFTTGCGETERTAFLDALAAIAATAPGGPVGLVVLGMRADFYPSATQYPALCEALQFRQLVVGSMTLAEVTRAIMSPARAVGLHLEPGLIERMLRDLGVGADGSGYEAGRLPLLGHALRATWQRRSGTLLTITGYEDAGGIGGAIAKAAEDAYNGLSPQAQQAARQLFLALIQVGGEPGGEGTADTRRRVSRARLCSSAPDPGAAAAVLDVFTRTRLITSGGQTMQITHEALLSRWPRLRDWIDQDRAGHLIRQPLEEAAEAWDLAGQDPASDLYTGSRLAQAQAWADDPAASRDLSGRARNFLDASGRRQRRALRRRNQIIAVLTALSLVAGAAAAFAALEDQTANQQRNAAVAGRVAAESEALDATNPVAAASLAAAAWKIDPTDEARASLLDVIAQPARGTVTAVSGNITTIAFSPDGKRFATATNTDVAQVWDTSTHREIGKPLAITGGDAVGGNSILFTRDDTAIAFHGGADGPSQFWNLTAHKAMGPPFQIAGDPIGGGIFSPDGKMVATGAVNGAFSIIDATTRREIGGPLPDTDPIAFSPTGKLLAVGLVSDGRTDGVVRLLDVAEHRLVGRPMPGGSANYGAAAAFSPDGTLIAVTGQDSVSIWDIARQRRIGPPITINATSVAFSPDGKILATTSSDGTTELWDTSSHQQLGGPHASGGLLAFSPDSKALATVTGSTATMWDVAIFQQIGAAIPGASAPVAFSPDGRLLAAAIKYGAGLWSVTRRRQVGTTITVNPRHDPQDTNGAAGIAFSPDGKTLATGGFASIPAQLWSVATHRKTGVREFPGHNYISAVAFSPDGKLLATSNGSSIWIRDVRTGRVVGRKMSSDDHEVPTTIAFSPDGALLATVGSEVRVYSIATHRQVGKPLAIGTGHVNDIAFSPDGRIIATASDSGAALWDVATQHQIGAPLTAGEGAVQALTFSPDGTLIATAGQDGAIRLWDVASREQIGPTLAVDRTTIYGIAFSPDGTLLAATTGYRTRIWGVALTMNILNRVCAIAGGSMTSQEWDSYIKSEPFQQACP